MLEQLSIEFIAFTIIGIVGVGCLMFWDVLKKGITSTLTDNISDAHKTPLEYKPRLERHVTNDVSIPPHNNSTNENIDDLPFYEQAINECDNNIKSRHLATWAKAFSIAEGDETKSRAKYIELRVKDLIREAQNKRPIQTQIALNKFVDLDICTGCTLCCDIAPDVFTMGDDGLAHSKVNQIPPGAIASAQEAAGSCPVSAISLN